MTKNVATTGGLLQAAASGKGYIEMLKKVLKDADGQIEPEKKGRSTIASRKAALQAAAVELDPEVMVPLQDDMQNYVDRMAAVEMVEPRTLTPAESANLMSEYLKYQPISEFLAARREYIRTTVLTSIDQSAAEKGLDPTDTNGRIDVPELGKSFRKERAGYKEPDLNQKKLAELLGEDADKVFVEEIVPATTKVVFSEEALMKLAQEKPEVMEKIRLALIPGAAKSAAFSVRDI